MMNAFFGIFSSNWDVIRMLGGGLMCVVGALVTIIGTVGVLRFPDFYSRTHAASMTDTFGAGLLLLGMAFMATGWIVVFKLLLIGLFLLVAVPTGSHAVVHAANVAGLHPLTGRYRSGAKDEEDEE